MQKFRKEDMLLYLAMRYFREFRLPLAVALLCIVPCLPINIASATAAVTKSNPVAEQWVRTQVDAGKEADLSTHFPNPIDRRLSASFLEQVLLDKSPSDKKRRLGVTIQYAVFVEDIDLRNAMVIYETRLERCRFDKTVTLDHGVFEKNLSFVRSAFNSTSYFALKVGGTASISEAVFDGPVNFTSADIAGNFVADYARFKGSRNSFNLMKVRSSAIFSDAVFDGPVNFVYANIAGPVLFTNAQFKSPKEAADFAAMKVGGMANFDKAMFDGPANFYSADVVGPVSFTNAQFKSPKEAANFAAMKVGGMANFDKAVFDGPVNFMSANVVGSFVADHAQFKNPTETANFAGMKVGGMAGFDRAVFDGPVDFRFSDIASIFFVNEAQFKNPRAKVDFSAMKVDFATFQNTVFTGPVEFELAHFHAIGLVDMTWPQEKGSIHLQGMTYDQINPGQKAGAENTLLVLVDQAAFSTNVYGALEEFFKREGQVGRANGVFIAQKWRERREMLEWYTFDYWWNWALYLLVGYGRRPEQAIAWSMLFIGVGCWIFRRPENMEVQKVRYASETYNAFWYSLGLFLPFVNLHAAEVWRPKNECMLARIYMRIHIIMGWVLVPIGLASLTGLIK